MVKPWIYGVSEEPPYACSMIDKAKTTIKDSAEEYFEQLRSRIEDVRAWGHE